MRIRDRRKCDADPSRRRPAPRNRPLDLLAYFRPAPADYLRHRFETGFLMPLQQQTSSVLRSRLGANSTVFQGAKKAWWTLRASL